MAGPQTENRVVADRYALRSILGRGGTGVVWRGEDTLLERPVAIKTVELPVTLPDDELEPTRQRVLREARAAARLSHPSAVTVYDVVEEHDRVYLVMELVEAPTLSEVVVREGPLDPAAAARLGLNLLEPLEAAHAEGIVHRDVKPSNVMVLDSGVKLADFGIASVKSDPSLTRTGMLLGSPPYMAPEQAEGAPSDDATDLWGLGATLYFAVEGHPPFGPGDPLPTLMSVVNEDPRPVRRAGRLAPVLDALLTKDPARRPTAAEAHSLLEEVAAEGPAQTGTATAALPDSDAPAPPAVAPATGTVAIPATVHRRSKRPLLALALLVVAAAVVAAVILVAPGSDDAGGPSNATATTTTSGAAAAPTGWVTYQDRATGYRIEHPRRWHVSSRGTQTRFAEPESGTYLLVDWTATPGTSPSADWRTQSVSFGASHQGYRELSITSTTFKQFPAATWEYVYSAGGAQLHAVDLGFVAGTRGYALNFQAREQDWARSQSMFERFKDSFQPGP